MMSTINSDFRDLILKRSHYIYLFENGMIKDMVDPFNRAKVDLMNKISKLEDYGQGWTLQYRLDTLNAKLHEIDIVLKYANDEGIGVVGNYLNEFGQTEKDFYDNLMGDKFGEIGIGINRLPIEQIHEIVNTPIGGLRYHDRMIKRYVDAMFDIKSDLTQSIIQGEDMAKASRRLFGIGQSMGGVIGNRLMQQSSVIARTEIMRVSNSVAQRIYEQNTDVLKGMVWNSTLDNRTCLVCGALDGKSFYFGKGMAPPAIPQHPNCRCALSPLTKSWAELGADQKIAEPDAGTKPFTYTGEKPLPGSREYLSVKNKWAGDVPDAMKYPEWLKMMDSQDQDFVKGILGPKRYDLWKSGKLEFNEMVRNNKIISIEGLGGKIGEPKKILGNIIPGSTVKSAKEILDHYEKSAGATFIEGKTAEELKRNVQERLGEKLFTFRSKEMDSFVKFTSGYKGKDLTEVRESVVKMIYKDATDNIIKGWAKTSGDTDPKSIMMQLAAKAEFKLESSTLWWEQNVLKEAEELFKIHGESAQKFLRIMYEDTQEYLKKSGLKTIRIARGHKGDIGINSTIGNPIIKTKIKLQPISSFSGDINVAKRFALPDPFGDPLDLFGEEKISMFFAEVPVERILFTPVTGFGCMEEREFVILGTKIKEELALVSSISKKSMTWEELFSALGKGEKGFVDAIMDEIYKVTK